MVRFRKQITIILIFAFLLSFAPDFLYNKSVALADCPYPDCDTVAEGTPCCEVIEKDGQTYCTNCPIECKLKTDTGTVKFENKSCLPLEGEWACGTEIPIGEVLDRSAYLAAKMADEFGVIIRAGNEMVDNVNNMLSVLPFLNCGGSCSTGCYKYFSIDTNGWELIEGSEETCSIGPQPSERVEVNEGCKKNASQCETCAECRTSGNCNQTITFAPDPEHPEETIACKYRPITTKCHESCSPSWCQGSCDKKEHLNGYCEEDFNSVIKSYSDIQGAQEDLKNDIDEKYKNEGGDTVSLPDTFKFKRSYTLQQLNFSRCELAQCWIPAEDYPDIIEGKKVGKNLFSCKTVSDSGLLEDDQMACSVLQIMEEWEEIQKLWEKPKSWWEWPIVVFQIAWKVITIGWRTLLTMIQEAFDIGKEEGCYPTNYYCCQM